MENNTFKETTVNDYLPKLYEKFPDVPKEDILRIVNYGWRVIYLLVASGCDVSILSTSNKLWVYIGDLYKDSLLHFSNYKKKLVLKMEFIFRKTKPNVEEYYTALSAEEFKLISKNKKHYIFNNKWAFRDKDACFVYYAELPYIIKFIPLIDYGFKYYKEELKLDSPELVLKTKSKTFKDILINNNDYGLINGKSS